ncbi:MAG TPA: VTT domain-containing protein [Candidatus Acidoferrales bacterium]|nr:VTT domain-containing protein [Candidatus Acidoferrales bacterium]
MPHLLYLSLWSWLERLGGVGLVLLGLIDNSPIPVPGSMDALLIILAAHQKGWWWYYAIMATIGGIVGAYAGFVLGRKEGKEALEKKISRQRAEKVYKKFDKGGFWTLFIGALLPPPVPFSPFPIAAGALNYPRRNLVLAVGSARGIRYFGLAFLARSYSREIFGFFHNYYKPVFWTLIGLAVAGAIAALIWIWKRKSEGKPVVPNMKDDTKKTKVA